MSRRSYSALELAAMFGDPEAIAELFTRPAVPERPANAPHEADLARQRAAGLAAFERAFVERGVPQATVRAQILMSAWPWLREAASRGR